MKSEYIFLLFGISMNGLFFLMGYMWCKLNNREEDQENNFSTTKKRNRKSNKNTMKVVDIDSSKVVVDIKTDRLEKKYENLGEVKQSEEKITNSVNKLKNMKR